MSPRTCTFATLALTAAAPLTAQNLFERPPLTTPGLPVLPADTAAIASGDVDGDLDDDFVVTSGSTALLYRQEAGGFAAEPLAGPGGAWVVAIADFDGDDRLDLLVGPIGSLFAANLRIFWGDAGPFPGTTTSDLPVPTTSGAAHVLAEDIDGDGDADIVFTGVLFSGAVGNVLLRNNGDRTFTTMAPSVYPTLGAGHAEAFLVDLDGDGKKDVVLVSRDAQTRLYWNDVGAFTPATPAQFPTIVTSQRGLAAADFDGDTDVDLVLGGDGDVGLFLRNAGARTFVQGPGSPTARRTVALCAADREGDGDIDLCVFGSTRSVELTNDGNGVFTEHRSFGGADDLRIAHSVDLDGDGDRDWLRVGSHASVSPPPPARVAASLTLGPGRYQHIGEVFMPVRASGSNPDVGDLDDDVFPDFLVAIDAGPAGGTIQFARHNDTGSLGYEYEPRVGGLNNGFFADLTGDGRDEYVFTGPAPAGVIANVDGHLALAPAPLPVAVWTDDGIAFDIDGDDDTDLVFATHTGNVASLIVLVQNGGAWIDETTLRVAVPSTAGSHPELHCADIDGDRDLDLWFHTNSSDRIYKNDGSGVFVWHPPALPPAVVAWSPSSTGDLDGDGDVDLSLGRFVLINDGTGTFADQSASVPNVLAATSLGRAVDLDDDGDLDIVGQGYLLWNDGAANFTASSTAFPFPYGVGIGVRTLVDTDLDGDPDLITNENPEAGYYLNLLRQSSLVTPGEIGGTLRIRYEARPGGTPHDIAVWLIGSFGRIPPLLLGSCGWLQIDPSETGLLGFAMLPNAGGVALFEQDVPNAPSLLGVYVGAQTLDLRGPRLRLGNLVETVLGRGSS